MATILVAGVPAPGTSQTTLIGERVESMGRLPSGSGWLLTEARLLWSENNGIDWADITPAPMENMTEAFVFFLDDQTGWVAQVEPSSGGGVEPGLVVARTSDGGHAWTAAATNASDFGATLVGSVHSMSFADALHGWVLLRRPSSSNFDGTILLHTSNGGASWERLPDPPGKGELSFVSPSHGWLSGGDEGDELFGTLDGGGSWQPVEIGPFDGYAFFDIPSFQGANGLLPVTISRAEGSRLDLYRTTDGGDTWSFSADAPLAVQPSGRAMAIGVVDVVAFADQSFAGIMSSTSAASMDVFPPEANVGIVSMVFDRSGVGGWALASVSGCRGPKTDCAQESRLLRFSSDGDVSDQTPWSSGLADFLSSPPRDILVSTRDGFDTCAAPSTGELSAWWSNSPFRDVNAYIGGVNSTCGLWNQSMITTSWVASVLSQGWGLIPTWVGLQAPTSGCLTCSKMSTDPSVARNQGISEAVNAAATAASLGLSGTVIYFDLENYDTTNAVANASAKAFVDGWVSQLHASGYVAGLYTNPGPLNQIAVIANPPDAVWIAAWNNVASVWNISGLSNALWGNGDQRLHQYKGGHDETWGGVLINIDSDISGGPVEVDGSGCVTPVGTGAANPTLFVDAYNRNGGEPGLGCPINTVHTWGSGTIQDLRGGSGGDAAIMLIPGWSTAYVVHGDIWLKYVQVANAAGSPDVPGYPISDEGSGANSSVSGASLRYSNFQNGAIEYHASGPHFGEAYWLGLGILNAWAGLGYGSSCLGFPLSDQTVSNSAIFEGGSIWYGGSSYLWSCGATRGDFNGDGKVDILWHHLLSGSVSLWTMNGTSYTGGVGVGAVSDTSWRIVGTNDFNGDGKTDILWHHLTSGSVTLWTMNGTTYSGAVGVGAVSDTGWRIVGTGDFNGDGKSDILWHHLTSGSVALWTMNGTSYSGGVSVGGVSDTNWRIVGTGDFNGDGKTDILWHHLTSGSVSLWTMNGTSYLGGSIVGAVPDTNWRIVGTGDFNGDGKTDILWQHLASGYVSVWLMNGTSYAGSASVGTLSDTNWRIVGPR